MPKLTHEDQATALLFGAFLGVLAALGLMLVRGYVSMSWGGFP